MDACCICIESTGGVRPPAGAGAACRAATAAALENEKKTSRTSFKDNGSEVETPTGEPEKTPPPREAGDPVNTSQRGMSDSWRPFNRLEEEEEDNRTLTWKNRPVPLTGPCSSGEKGLEGGKNKALSEGGANTWMGGLSSIQQEKRLEEQKVWASLGVPERTT